MLSVSHVLCGYETGNESLRYGHARDGAGAPPRPIVVWALTKACNLRCVHCYASAEPHAAPGELTHEEGRRLLEDLASFDVPAVLFSGGEPLARPDAEALIEYAVSLGLRCTLSTNGVLIDDPRADRLAGIGLRYVGISLDGTRARHDKLRGMSGAFDAAVAGIRRCRARGIKVGLRYTVHALNVADLDAMFDLCVAHDVQRLCIYHLAYAGRGGSMQKVDLSADQTREVVDRIFERTAQLHGAGHELEVLTVGNHADAAYALMHLERAAPDRAARARRLLSQSAGNRSGCHLASVDPLGGVHYDQFSWHYTCGNVRERRFSDIWTDAGDPRLAVLRNRRAHLPARCRGCRFLDVCNGNLRTRAEAATGDWLGLDPSCYLTDQEILMSEPVTTRPVPNAPPIEPSVRPTVVSRVTSPPLELVTHPRAFQPNPTTVRFARAVTIEEGDVVFDIGTGIGPLALMAARHGARRVVAIDPVSLHVRLARQNVARYGYERKVEVCHGSLFEPFVREPHLRGLRADVIIGDVSGIADAVSHALGWYSDIVPTGGYDGTQVITDFLRQVPNYLAPGGRVYFPIAVDLSDGQKILETVEEVFAEAGNALSKPYVEFPLTAEQVAVIDEAYGANPPPFIRVQRGARPSWRGQIWVASGPRSG